MQHNGIVSLIFATCHGWLGGIIPTAYFSSSFLTSSRVAAPLVDHLSTCNLDVYQHMYQSKHELRISRHNDLSAQADLLSEHLSPHL